MQLEFTIGPKTLDCKGKLKGSVLFLFELYAGRVGSWIGTADDPSKCGS